MDSEMLNKIVPVKLFGIEKHQMRDDATFIGEARKTNFTINLLYENTEDPADNVHKFGLLPENPNFIKIQKALKDEEIDSVDEYPLEQLSASLHDMYGAWVNVDMSETPVCRVYTDNLCKMVDGKPKIIHKAGDPMHKIDPATKEDTPELAVMTIVPVWGFLRKASNGNWIWLKGNDPKTRIQREINQGRLIYVNKPEEKKIEQPEKVEEKQDTTTLGQAPDINQVGVA